MAREEEKKLGGLFSSSLSVALSLREFHLVFAMKKDDPFPGRLSVRFYFSLPLFYHIFWNLSIDFTDRWTHCTTCYAIDYLYCIKSPPIKASSFYPGLTIY